jgi:hypothetical protein
MGEALRMILDLPLDYRSHQLAAISACASIIDVVCRCAMDFIVDCFDSNSGMIRFSVCRAVFSPVSSSVVGVETLFCVARASIRHSCSCCSRNKDIIFTMLGRCLSSKK